MTSVLSLRIGTAKVCATALRAQVGVMLAVALSVGISPQAIAQIVEVTRTPTTGKGDGSVAAHRDVEVLGRAYFDYFVSGSGQASAQVVRLRIGEPDKFNVPVFLLVGSTGDVGESRDAKQNANTAAAFLNPVAGNITLAFQKKGLFARRAGSYTQFGLSVESSVRSITGVDLQVPAETRSTWVFTADAGLYFQTAAWEDQTAAPAAKSTSATDTAFGQAAPEAQATDYGVFWMQARVVGSTGSAGDLKHLFGLTTPATVYSWSIEGGIAVKDRVNIRLGAYRTFSSVPEGALASNYVKIGLDYRGAR